MEHETIGGGFALLALFHFVVDWGFQTHAQAMAKARNAWVRTVHCLIYTLGLLLAAAWLFHPSAVTLAYVGLWLFPTHWLIDTYRPVYCIRKYLQRDPDAQTIADFAESFKTPRGFAMSVVLDQTLHLLCLLPVARFFASS